MNLTRLMVLSVLDGHGERHGHQLRRTAEQTDVARWGGVNVGALYRELSTMAVEGLVRAVRTEQVGRRPARTVYAVTDAGRHELDRLREEAIGDIIGGPDATGVALTFGGDSAPVRTLLTERLRALKQARAGVVAERRRLLDEGLIDAWTAALFDRRRLLFEAEIRWLERLLPRGE